MEVIIVEDNKLINSRISDILNDILDKYNIRPILNSFYGYDDKLQRALESNHIKIIILDIKMKGKSGYDIAREVRQKYNDWNSIIIIVTSYSMENKFLKSNLMILSYIHKDEFFEETLRKTFEIALKIVLTKKTIKIKENYRSHYINLESIIYIEKEKGTKYCIIKTKRRTYRTRDTIKNLKSNTQFKKIKKHLLINEQNFHLLEETK